MPTPKITLYRTNGACSLVPHSILTHFAIPFNAVEMEPTPDGTDGIGGRWQRSFMLRSSSWSSKIEDEVLKKKFVCIAGSKEPAEASTDAHIYTLSHKSL